MSGPGQSLARHRKVKGYTSSNSIIKTLQILTSCAAVIFTDSENSNMDDSVRERPLGPQRPPLSGRLVVVTG